MIVHHKVYLVGFLNFNFFCDFSGPTSNKLVLFISTIGQISFTKYVMRTAWYFKFNPCLGYLKLSDIKHVGICIWKNKLYTIGWNSIFVY